mgnify:CR=1 FL=1
MLSWKLQWMSFRAPCLSKRVFYPCKSTLLQIAPKPKSASPVYDRWNRLFNGHNGVSDPGDANQPTSSTSELMCWCNVLFTKSFQEHQSSTRQIPSNSDGLMPLTKVSIDSVPNFPLYWIQCFMCWRLDKLSLLISFHLNLYAQLSIDS